ncbi:copper resistance protein CopC [Streptomyces sp. NPDC002734]|uniref:copper resistance CopC/CopD family protein n=1 Tax=Streptomyces sp. NPDC002734 TaxID=3154426 RepID=UPI0033312079
MAGLLLAGAGPASAHAALTGSDPKQGAVVNRAPEQVTLTFSEKVAVSADSVRVLDPEGNRVDIGKAPSVDGTSVRVTLHEGLPFGTFTVAYQVVSEDSHPVAGAYTYSVGAPSQTSVTLSEQSAGGGVVGTLYDVARYVSYAGFTVLVGGAAFVLICWRRGAGVRALQRLVVGGWLALTVGTLALLLLRGAYIGSGKLGDIADMGLLAQVLRSSAGAALVCRLLLLAVAALFVAVLFGTYQRRADGAEKRDLSFGLTVGGVVVAAGLAATWALSEHASAGLQPGIAMPVDVIHLLAVALWLGGLTALLVALYRRSAEITVERAAVHRFSRVAFLSVAALAVTGVYQSWRQVGSWDALTSTSYGRLLIVKAGLVALLVGIAWISRRWTRRLDDAEAEGAAGAEPAEGAEDVQDAQEADERTAEPGQTAEVEAARSVGAAGTAGAGAAGADAAGEPGVRAGAGEAAGELGATSTMGSVGAASAAAAVGSAGAAAAVAHLAGEVPAQKTGSGDGDDDADPRRAEQLARQRAAVETARRRKERDADAPRAGLRRSVLAEVAVAVVVLAVTTALTGAEPGRTEQQARAAAASLKAATGTVSVELPFDTGGKDGDGVVRLEFVPAQVGENIVHVYAEHSYGAPYDLPELKVALTLEDKNVGPLPVSPKHISSGHWSAAGVQIPMAGDWKVSVTVRTSDIDQVTVDKNVKIG